MRSAAAVLAVLACSAVLTACLANGRGADGHCGIDDAQALPDRESTFAHASEDGYIGQTLTQARRLASSRGDTVRVVGTDGECADVTDDFQPRRINVHVEDGAVSAVAVL